MASARAHLFASLVLAALVATELAIKWTHLVSGTRGAHALAVVALGALALTGSGGVIAFHMRLRQEPRWLKLLFVLPLLYPALFAIATIGEAMYRGLRP